MDWIYQNLSKQFHIGVYLGCFKGSFILNKAAINLAYSPNFYARLS